MARCVAATNQIGGPIPPPSVGSTAPPAARIAATCAAVQADGRVDARDAAAVRRRAAAAVEVPEVLWLAVELAVLAVARAGKIADAAGVGVEVVRIGPGVRTSGGGAVVVASAVAVGVAAGRAPGAKPMDVVRRDGPYALKPRSCRATARLCASLAPSPEPRDQVAERHERRAGGRAGGRKRGTRVLTAGRTGGRAEERN